MEIATRGYGKSVQKFGKMSSVWNSKIQKKKNSMNLIRLHDISWDLVSLLSLFPFIILSVGDLPVLTLRWHLLTFPNGDHVARIDRCGVLPSYRSQRLASQTMELVVKDIHSVSQIHGILIPFLQILAPQDSALEHCLQRHGYSIQNPRPQQEAGFDLVMRGGVVHRYLGQSLS
jgi:hypothetical protein